MGGECEYPSECLCFFYVLSYNKNGEVLMRQKKYSRYKKGSILKRTIGKKWPVWPYHMGIYIGSGRVIQFDRPRMKKVTVSKVTLEEFSQGKEIFVHAVPKSNKEAKKILEKALFFLKYPETFGDYNFFVNNCEDFAVKMFGKKNTLKSQRKQVLEAIFILVLQGLPLLSVLSAAHIAKTIVEEKKRQNPD